MPSEQEVAYHRSFLSAYYLENLNTPGWFVNRRKPEEIEAIRLRDEEEFERVRENLAKALKVNLVPGMYVAEANVPLVGERRTKWREGYPLDYQVAEVIVHTHLPQGAVKHPTTGMIALPNVHFLINAYVDGKPLHPALMYPKTDQEFETIASPWERLWSNLIYPYTRGFTPIINDSYKVIGHYGEVEGGPSGHHRGRRYHGTVLRVPRKVAISSLTLEQAMAKGVTVFVDNEAAIPPGWENGTFYTSQHKIEVRTGLDGEVVDFQLFNKGYLIQPWYSPTDVFFAGKILVNLVMIGAKVTGSLMRRSTAKLRNRAVLNGPTEALAEEVAQVVAIDVAKASIKESFNKVEERIIKEVREILKSPEIAKIRQAHATGKPVTVKIGGRVIQYEPINASGMTLFGENGFLVGREAFKSEAEFVKTLLHETHRLVTSEIGQGAGAHAAIVALETERAFNFAERAYQAVIAK